MLSFHGNSSNRKVTKTMLSDVSKTCDWHDLNFIVNRLFCTLYFSNNGRTQYVQRKKTKVEALCAADSGGRSNDIFYVFNFFSELVSSLDRRYNSEDSTNDESQTATFTCGWKD